MKSFLELGGDECDNLHFKIDSFKIRNNSWILEKNLKFIKFEFSIRGQGREPVGGSTTIVCDARPVRRQTYGYVPSLCRYQINAACWQPQM